MADPQARATSSMLVCVLEKMYERCRRDQKYLDVALPRMELRSRTTEAQWLCVEAFRTFHSKDGAHWAVGNPNFTKIS